MKKMLILALLLIPLAAQARFEKIASDVNALFNRMSGYIVSVDENMVYSDLGSGTNVYPGLVMKVYRENEEIVHPITGQLLGRKKTLVGDAVVQEVHENYSVLKVFSPEQEPKNGDLVVLNPPVEVAVQTVNIPVRLELLIKEDIAKVQNIIFKDNAQIALVITQKDEGGIQLEAKDTKSGTLIASAFYADIEAEDSAKLTRDSFQSDMIDAEYVSMTVGHILDKNELYAAVASKKQVDVYRFSGNDFEKKAELSGDFSHIVSIDSADLNGDGIEEIFVSWLEFDKVARTNIYEYDGSKFVLKAEKLPFFSRVSYVRGEKTVLTQKMATDGTFTGLIQKLEYKGGYSRGQNIAGSAGKKLFGFGYMTAGADEQFMDVYIADSFRLTVSQGNKTLYESAELFSQTPNYIQIQTELPNQKVNKKLKEVNTMEMLEKRQFIKGRIFFNDENRLYLIKNQTMSDILLNTFSYKGSAFVVYGWNGSSMTKIWESDTKEPVIVDYYMYEEYGRTYLFMLRSISGGWFSSPKSQLEYIETK